MESLTSLQSILMTEHTAKLQRKVLLVVHAVWILKSSLNTMHIAQHRTVVTAVGDVVLTPPKAVLTTGHTVGQIQLVPLVNLDTSEGSSSHRTHSKPNSISSIGQKSYSTYRAKFN